MMKSDELESFNRACRNAACLYISAAHLLYRACLHYNLTTYFFFRFKKALAAAKRAIGTRNGEQLT